MYIGHLSYISEIILMIKSYLFAKFDMKLKWFYRIKHFKDKSEFNFINSTLSLRDCLKTQNGRHKIALD